MTRILLLLLLTTFCRAQERGKTVVFKVRAQPTACSISFDNDFFPLEILNAVHVKLEGRNRNIKVFAAGGQLMSVKEDTYYFRFLKPGATNISVYLYTPTGRELLVTKQQLVKNPAIYFCGIRVDSSSKYLNIRGSNFYAYSDYYKKEMPVISFEMYYVDDTLVKKIQPVFLKSDTCMLSPQMKKIVFSFQPNHNYMYFHNIICRVPDGSKRLLDPVEFQIMEDKNNKERLSLIYSVKRKKL
jgi:hypothetical protein